jgi:hypothetical protein
VSKFKNFDNAVEKELYLMNQRYKDNSDDYKSLLLLAVGLLVEGKKSLFKIKKELKESVPALDITDDFVKIASQQSRIITGDKTSDFSLSKESYAGLSFKESLEDRRRSIVKSLFSFIVDAKNELADTSAVPQPVKSRAFSPFVKDKAVLPVGRNTFSETRTLSSLVNNHVKRYQRRDDAFYNTQTKAAREYAYRSVDDKNKNIKGWLSLAVLDNRTSVICVGLANKYYSVKQYPTRRRLPNPPPRHPNCRSMFFGVEYGERIQSFMTQTADDFLHRNPETAKGFLGEEKHRLWLESDTSINNFIDLNRGVLFTNEQIKRKFFRSSYTRRPLNYGVDNGLFR